MTEPAPLSLIPVERSIEGSTVGAACVEERAEDAAEAGLVARGARAGGLVGDLRLVVDGDDDGEDVADLVGALVLEEAAGFVQNSELGW